MIEQLYRVCWRTYYSGIQVHERVNGRERLPWPNVMSVIAKCKTLDAKCGVYSDYWAAPV